MPLPGMTHDVFISYTQRDEAVAGRIERGLTEAGLKVWFAPKSILPAESWMGAINAGLAGSEVLLALYSPDSLASNWVGAESDTRMSQRLGRVGGYKMLPVLINGAQTSDLPPLVQNIQSFDFKDVDFSDPKQAHDAVDKLARHLAGEPPPDELLAVPVVVFAMTREEATLLANREIFQHEMATARDEQIFNRLAEKLDYTVAEIPQFYRDLRDDWTPPMSSDRDPSISIKQSVQQMIDSFNERRAALRVPPPAIYPQFYSSELLSSDQAVRSRTARALQSIGCVLIIDTLSLFHPGLREKLNNSGLVTSPENISIVVLSPVRRGSLPISEVLERDISRLIERAFERFKELDRLCEFGVVNSLALNRWLFYTLPEAATAALQQRAHGAARRAVSKLNSGTDASVLLGRGRR